MFIRAALWRPFALSLLFFSSLTHAAQRQRIALVLEGGGALGFAHIGALQWLEENHIPVDVVAGTSMGGLVGGLYAAGMSPSDIKDLVANVNWPAVLETQPEFQTLGFRRKQDRVSYPNLLNFGLRNGLSLPSGLNSGQLIDQQLDRVLLPYFSMTSFDDLPIPFRCVATDLVSGKEVHFDHGSLATAIRATISIPALFSPESDNGALYIDGGLLNNLPVDVAKSLHPDIVIAVFLDTGPFDRSSVESLVGVTGRSASIVIAANELHNMQAADVLLTADVKDFGSTDFTKSAEIAPRGYAAAQAKKQLLSNFALPPDEWQQYLASRSARIRKTAPAPEFTEVTGTSPRNQRAIQSALAADLGKPINADLLDRQLDRINAQGIFNSLQYTLIERSGKTGLAIRAEEKTNAPPFINLGAIVNGADPNDVRLGLAARLTFLNLGAFRSEWRTDISFGNTYEVASEYYAPLGTSKWFIAPRASAGKSRFDLYDNRNRTAEYSLHRAGAGFDLGYALNRRAELRLGEDLVHHEADLKIGTPFAPNYARTWGDTSLRFEYLGQDAVVVPHRGLSAEARFDLHSSGPLDGSYRSAEAKLNWFAPVSEDGALFFTANGGSAFGAKNLGLESFTLGGPFRLGAYGINELIGNQFWLGQAGYSHRLFAFNPLFGGALYGLAFLEAGKMYSVHSNQNVPLDGSIVVVTKTAVGPIFFGTSMAGADRLKWWFGMGRVF